jgi:Uma2 family endonuclease
MIGSKPRSGSQLSSAKEKNELHNGQVVAMAGASLAHNEIVANVLGNVKNYLKGKSKFLWRVSTET